MAYVLLVMPNLPARCRNLNLFTLVIMMGIVPYVLGCPKDCACYSQVIGQSVSCRYQNLDEVPSGMPIDTVELDMGHAKLTVLTSSTFPFLPELRKLTLDWCQIVRIDANAFISLPNLEEIILSKNMLTEIHSNTFTGLFNLKKIHLDYNNIKRLPQFAFKELSLDELKLHSNNMETLEVSAFEGTSITSLNLDENNISNISMELFNPLRNSLKYFNLSHNAQPLTMEENVFSGFNFSDLKISYDGLKDPSFLKYVKAESIDISGHPFANLDFKDWENLKTTKELYLRNLSIDKINESIVINLASVTLLDLSQNKLISLDGKVFQHTPQLKVLRLDYNYFMSLPENLGLYLDQLEVLKVPWNNLGIVRPDAFQGMTNLKELDMRHNLIQVIQEPMKEIFNELEKVALGGNPLHCNCEMQWFRRWLDFTTMDTGANDCYSPLDVRGYIYDIAPEDFICRPAEVQQIPKNMNAMEGENVYLQCKAEGDPAPEVQWISPFGETVSVTPPFNRTKYISLAIWQIQARNGGWFTCRASNLRGVDEQSMYIHVVTEHGSTIDLKNLTMPTTTTISTSTTTVTTPTTTPTATTTTTKPTTTNSETTTNPETTATIPSTATMTSSTAESRSSSHVASETTEQPIRSSTTGTGDKDLYKGKRQGLDPWKVAVIVSCILGTVLIFTTIGIICHFCMKKKKTREYSVNLESGVPMVSNNNHTQPGNHVVETEKPTHNHGDYEHD